MKAINIKHIKKYLQKKKIASLNNISIYEILQIYIQGITKGAIGIRAAAASWSLFMSLFPFLILFLLFISRMPYYEEILQIIYNFLLKKLLPTNIFEIVNNYMNKRIDLVNNNLKQPNLLLLIFSIFLFIILSSKGVRSLIRGFKSINNHEPIEFKGFKSFLLSIFIVLFFTIFLFLSLLLIYITEIIFRVFQDSLPLNISEYRLAINILNFILSIFIFFIGICFLYYWGRTAKFSFKEVMPGAFLTTILFSLTTYFFGYYITYFTRFNFLYGSIGSVLIIMIWINLSVMLTLIGYEFNIALRRAKYSISENSTSN